MNDIGIGSVVAGQYKVVRFINRGSFGAVYEAEEVRGVPGRRCALKMLRSEYLLDQKSRELFMKEAQIASVIGSSHVVTVFNASPGDEQTPPWIALELLKGHDLAEEMALKQRLPVSQVRRIFSHLQDAVGRAHTLNDMVVLHRDLKPANIFLVEPWRADGLFTTKVVDYGIGKILADGARHAQLSVPMGTLLWVAPEQVFTGATIGTGVDVWALGLIAFYLLTGVYYWDDAPDVRDPATMVAHYQRLLHAPLASASARAHGAQVGAYLPRGFDAWFGRCVVRESHARWPDGGVACAELVALLDRAMDDSTGVLPPVGPEDVELTKRRQREETAALLRKLFTEAVALHDVGEILRVGSQLLALIPDDHALRETIVAAWMGRARELEELGQTEDADRALEAARTLLPQAAGPAYVTGLVLSKRGESARALVELNRAVELAPGVLHYREERARTHFELGRLGEALTDIDAALTSGESSARLRTRAGIRLASGLRSLGLEDAQRAVALDEARRSAELAASLRCRARMLVVASRWRDALADWDRAIKLSDASDPKRGQDHYDRALARRHEGDAVGAHTDLQEASRRGHPLAAAELKAWR